MACEAKRLFDSKRMYWEKAKNRLTWQVAKMTATQCCAARVGTSSKRTATGRKTKVVKPRAVKPRATKRTSQVKKSVNVNA